MLNKTPSPQSGRQGRWLLKALPVFGACLAIGLLVAFALSKRPKNPVSETVEMVDIEGTKAKAEAGNAEAQKDLGTFHAKGQGVKQSYVEAAKWYQKAAEQGHAGGQTALAELYEAGQGVACDEDQAARWYRMAAEQGHVGGQYSLAVLYTMGKGVPRDISEAVRWYRRAAEQGNALAQYNLGMRYREGDGTPKDLVEAYGWLSLAAAQGLEDAIKARADLKPKLTRAQIDESQRRTQTFVKK